MTVNLKQYFKNNAPTLNYAIDGTHELTPDDVIVINDNGGNPAPNVDRTDWVTQIISRAVSPLTAKEQIQSIYTLVDRMYEIILPATTETLSDGTVINYPVIKTYQMSAIQKPRWFGYDENGLARYVFNMKTITR